MAKNKEASLAERLEKALSVDQDLLKETLGVIELNDAIQSELDDVRTEMATAQGNAQTAVAELETLKSDLTDAQLEIADLKEAKSGKPLVVKGTFEVEVVHGGKSVKKKLKFKPGAVLTRLKSGEPVPSESLIKLAKGEKVSDDELKRYEALTGLKSTDAKDWLKHLAQIGYGMIEEVA
jgi:uncharacterized coiled-coil DUF342 family protein